MLGQAYVLWKLWSDIKNYRIEFTTFTPKLKVVDKEKMALLSVNNRIKNHYYKTNDTWFDISKKVSDLNKTRNYALPLIKKLKVSNVENIALQKKLESFFTLIEPNKEVRNFISALNMDPDYEKYKYKVFDLFGPKEPFHNANSLTIMNYRNDTKKCGGPITTSLESDTAKGIMTPDITSIINNKEVLGFYSIRNLIEKPHLKR